MVNIFETKTKDGKIIRLTERQWLHIKQRHPEMAILNGDGFVITAYKTRRI